MYASCYLPCIDEDVDSVQPCHYNEDVDFVQPCHYNSLTKIPSLCSHFSARFDEDVEYGKGHAIRNLFKTL